MSDQGLPKTISPDGIPDLLRELGITFQWFEHQPVFTTAEAASCGPIPGCPTKNLFLRDKSGAREFLVVVPDQKRVDLKQLAVVLNATKLSFGSPERLARSLAITPGAVSYLCIVNDCERRVSVIVDEEVWNAPAMQCHPLRNDATVVMQQPGMIRIAELNKHEPQVIVVPQLS